MQTGIGVPTVENLGSQYFLWSVDMATVSDPHIRVSKKAGISAKDDCLRFEVTQDGERDFYASLKDLESNTTYYFRACAKIGGKLLMSEEKTFTTVPVHIGLIQTALYDSNKEHLSFFAMNAKETRDLPSVDFFPMNTSDDRTITWSTDSDLVTLTNDGKITAGASAGEAVLTLRSSNGKTSQCTVFIRSEEAAKLVGSQFADLGLRVFWAVHNVGTNKYVEPGEYYAWGEKTPKSTYTTDNYTLQTWVSNNRTTLDTLPAEYDVAHEAYDSNPCVGMPTRKEARQLLAYCEFELQSLGGYPIIRAKSKVNGKSIYLTPSGYYNGSEKKSPDECFFWTSTFDSGVGDYYDAIDYQEPFYAWTNISTYRVGCFSSTHKKENPYRPYTYGLPVRAVAR